MANKFFSIIIVPHTRTNFRTLSFSKRSMKLIAGGAALFSILLVVFLVDYLSMSVVRSKYRKLARETAEQKEKIASYENSLLNLRSSVAAFENYDKKLNVMMGFKSPDIIKGEPGLGGGDPNAEAPENQVPLAQIPSLQVPTGPAMKNLVQKAEGVEKNLSSLVNLVEMQASRLAMTPSIWPAQGWVNSPFGYRVDPFTGKKTFHYGIDIATNPGNPILATAEGNVLTADYDKFYGKNVTISHGGGIVTRYCHMEKYIVKPGQKIKRGDVIGYIGRTGKAVGPHLHYEIRINGKAVNPYDYIFEE
jgi:murein DD-endopeptidase MepM/ murein hydrolase activator NlpD